MLTSLPNLLTLLRIVIIPVLVGVMYFDNAMARWIALGLYSVACITDYFDGYLARHYNEVSPLGRFLDPIADKLLIAAVILMLSGDGRISGLVLAVFLPLHFLFLCREILVSGLREYLAEIRVPMPVSKLAKWKTVIQMLALGFLIVGDAGPEILPTRLIGEVGIWAAAILTFITGYDYLQRGLKHMLAK